MLLRHSNIISILISLAALVHYNVCCFSTVTQREFHNPRFAVFCIYWHSDWLAQLQGCDSFWFSILVHVGNPDVFVPKAVIHSGLKFKTSHSFSMHCHEWDQLMSAWDICNLILTIFEYRKLEALKIKKGKLKLIIVFSSLLQRPPKVIFHLPIFTFNILFIAIFIYISIYGEYVWEKCRPWFSLRVPFL